MIYVYRCPEHGEFEAEYPMGQAPPTTYCMRRWDGEEPQTVVQCNRVSKRVYTPPAIHFGPGFSPYGDRVQTSRELDEHFGSKR